MLLSWQKKNIIVCKKAIYTMDKNFNSSKFTNYTLANENLGGS